MQIIVERAVFPAIFVLNKMPGYALYTRAYLCQL